MTTGVERLLHKQYIFTNSVSNCFGLGPVQIPKIFFLNYSIKCQHTHILACSSYDLIRNMMLTLVCQSRPTGAAHLVRKKHSVASFSWNPTKRGQPKQTLMSLIGASFCIILNDSSMKKNPKHAYLPTEESRQRRGGGVTVLNPYKSTRFHCVTKQPVVSRIQSPIYRWS